MSSKGILKCCNPLIYRFFSKFGLQEFIIKPVGNIFFNTSDISKRKSNFNF